MGLEFAPLGWIYHDGWKWKETKQLISYDSDGNPTIIDKSKNFHQMGHCHLFLTDFDTSKASSSLAYWGTQTYSFNIKDEWGPNSNDPNQNYTTKLLGKPIWYFYVEEYWRRMYIHPWDKVDPNCKFPLNQTIVYDKYTLLAYMDKLLVDNKWLNSAQNIDPNWAVDSYYDYNNIGFNDYLIIKRRAFARKLWAAQFMPDYNEETTSDWEIVDYITQERSYQENPENYYWQLYTGSLNNPMITFKNNYNIYTAYAINDVVIFNNNYWLCIKDNSGSPPPASTSFNFKNNFDDFYNNNAEKYQGYVDRIDAMKQFLSLKDVDLNQYKQDTEGNIYIPQKEKQGHVGIKYDASLPCHSLGPFREGGGFYFFSTVVNRTMPLEYWIDEDKKTRQYYLKQNDCDDTTGGGTWTFTDDNNHFIWVEDNFDEMQNSKYGWGKEWESDNFSIKSSGDTYTYDAHRLRNIYNEWGYYYTYVYTGQNAKRIKTDKNIYISEDKYYIPQTGKTEDQTWYGTNAKVLHNKYEQKQYLDKMNNLNDFEKGNITINKNGDLVMGENMGYYDDTGYHLYTDQEKSSSSSEYEQSPNAIHWEQRTDGWKGWYETDEIIKCHHNNTYYKRQWKPYLYNINEPYKEQTENVYKNGVIFQKGNAPHWTWKKRQSFPNPPPYLCDENYKFPKNESSSSSSGKEYLHFAINPEVYEKDNDNRIHLLHWEYCHYYNLIRYYYGDNRSYSPQRYYIYNVPAEDTQNGIARKEYWTYQPTGEWYEKYVTYDKEIIACDWETAIDDYVKENGEITTIEEENQLFNNFLSKLPSQEFYTSDYTGTYYYSPLYYQDYYKYVYFDKYNNPITIKEEDINSDGTFNKPSNEKDENGNIIYIKTPLPNPQYIVNYNNNNLYTGEEYLTYITFGEFKNIWVPLTEKEQKRLNLHGDYPKRNETPYPVPTFDEAYGEDSSSSEYEMSQEELEFKTKMLKELKEKELDEASPSLLLSDFFPRIDSKTRQENDIRGKMKPPQPPFKLSKLDEVDQIPLLEPIDPYRNGTVNPIDNWKKYFNKREVYTIPHSTTVKGDYPIASPEGTPHIPYVHPRELSYSEEDGARRYYPNDKFVTPIIEYQKIIRLNWERLPGKEQDEYFIQNNWETDKTCNWGDGFETSIQIPFKINEEIQSPFSDASKITKPIGEYFHDCVKPEDMYRYRIEFYNSLDMIRFYDFPNYVNIIHNFQMQHLPEEMQDDLHTSIDEDGDEIIYDAAYEKSLYQEDFNDYEKTLAQLEDEKFVDPVSGLTWKYLLEQYFKKLDEIHNFSNNPIVRCHDCYGNEIKENTFVKLNNGKWMWRSELTHLFPTIDKVAYTFDDAGNEVPGYRNSKGEIIKGGKVVQWNDPYHQDDGKWVEQCLGAIVRVKCVQIFEDSLGYRWKQETTETALQTEEPLRGMDYDSIE